jgi:hypothetical protein
MNMKPAYPDLLPALTDEEYARLKNAIEKEGLLIPIEIDADKPEEILDGWHRYLICQELGREISDQQKTPRRFADEAARKWHCVSLNVNRRQLTKSQIAMYIVDYKLEPEEQKAKERQRANGRNSRFRGEDKMSRALLPYSFPETGKAVALAIKECQAEVSAKTVSEAKVVKKKSPDLADAIRKGKMSISTAMIHLGRPRNTSGKTRKITEPTFIETLLANLRRKRKEVHDVDINSRWNPHAIRLADLHDILDWVDSQLANYTTNSRKVTSQRAIQKVA